MYLNQTPPRTKQNYKQSYQNNLRDVSPITTKKEQYRIDIIQNEIDIIKFDIQNQLLRQNELRLRTLTKEINQDFYSDKTQVQNDLFQARDLINSLQSENQNLVVTIKELQYENERQRSINKTKVSIEEQEDESNEVQFLKSEIQRLQDVIQINDKNNEQNINNQSQNQDKEVLHWKENCQRLLEAYEEMSQKKKHSQGSEHNTPQRHQENDNLNQQFQIQQQQLNLIKQLQVQIQDRDLQISAFKQIFAASPKVTIKFPPCLRITTVMGQPVIVPLNSSQMNQQQRNSSPMVQQSRNMSPINSQQRNVSPVHQQAQTISPLKPKQTQNYSPTQVRNVTPMNSRHKEQDTQQIKQDKNVFIQDCQVGDQRS